VRHVIIMADNDRSGAGERAARSAAQHWLAEGRKVQIVVPGEIGFDINDVLIARTEAHHVAA
jgi:phage/plasmid primase-like uncharacterized protein